MLSNKMNKRKLQNHLLNFFYFCVCLHDNNATTAREFNFTRLSPRSRSGCLKIYKTRQRLELQYQSRKHWQTKTPIKMNSFSVENRACLPVRDGYLGLRTGRSCPQPVLQVALVPSCMPLFELFKSDH